MDSVPDSVLTRNSVSWNLASIVFDVSMRRIHISTYELKQTKPSPKLAEIRNLAHLN